MSIFLAIINLFHLLMSCLFKNRPCLKNVPSILLLRHYLEWCCTLVAYCTCWSAVCEVLVFRLFTAVSRYFCVNNNEALLVAVLWFGSTYFCFIYVVLYEFQIFFVLNTVYWSENACVLICFVCLCVICFVYYHYLYSASVLVLVCICIL